LKYLNALLLILLINTSYLRSKEDMWDMADHSVISIFTEEYQKGDPVQIHFDGSNEKCLDPNLAANMKGIIVGTYIPYAKVKFYSTCAYDKRVTTVTPGFNQPFLSQPQKFAAIKVEGENPVFKDEIVFYKETNFKFPFISMGSTPSPDAPNMFDREVKSFKGGKDIPQDTIRFYEGSSGNMGFYNFVKTGVEVPDVAKFGFDHLKAMVTYDDECSYEKRIKKDIPQVKKNILELGDELISNNGLAVLYICKKTKYKRI